MLARSRMMQYWRLVILAVSALATACGGDNTDPSPPPSAQSPSPEPRLPIAEAPLDRKAFLLAMSEAASAFASGRDDLEQQRGLNGKRIEIRLRIGCSGSAIPTRRVSYKPDERQLEISVAPEISASDELVASLGLTDFEAVEGLWIWRPWMLASDCPTIAPPPMATPSPTSQPSGKTTAPRAAATAAPEPPGEELAVREEPRIGIAQFFTATDSRALQRGERGYEVSRKLPAGEEPSAQGYDFVVSGRLQKLPDGRVIVCAGSAVRQAPKCLASAHIDRVQVVHPQTGATLAEWSS